ARSQAEGVLSQASAEAAQAAEGARAAADELLAQAGVEARDISDIARRDAEQLLAATNAGAAEAQSQPEAAEPKPEPPAPPEPVRLALELGAASRREGPPAPNLELEPSAALPALPEPGRDPVDEDEAHPGGTLVASAAVARNQLSDRRRDELIALARSHYVDVVLRQQPHLAGRRGERPVAGENEAVSAVHADLLEVAGELVEQRPRLS